MGTTRAVWRVHHEIGRAVGLPVFLGGLALDEMGATRFGLAVCADANEATGLLHVADTRVVIQGFRAVGRPVACLLRERGAVMVAVAEQPRRGP